MTGRRADAEPDDRHPQRVTGAEADPDDADPKPDAEPDLELEPDPDPDLDPDLGPEDDVIDLLFSEAPDSDLDFLLIPLFTEAERQMRSIERPLDAEMWASELLGMLELDASEESTAEEKAEATLNLATRLSEFAVDQESPSGLAVLRTLSVIAPPEARPFAQESATQMVADGLHDQPWVSSLGRPTVGRCWRLRDPEGAQESVTVVFAYGRQEHTLTVLIDHTLGGGVKDCWIGEDPDALLAETRAGLASSGIEIEVVGLDEVTPSLQQALSLPECPQTSDEREDLALGRAIMHARVEHLLTL